MIVHQSVPEQYFIAIPAQTSVQRQSSYSGYIIQKNSRLHEHVRGLNFGDFANTLVGQGLGASVTNRGCCADRYSGKGKLL